MAVTELVPVEEYMATTYEPDREYVEGRLLERYVGERDHSLLPYLIAKRLDQRELIPLTEFRVRLTADRFRIPDVTAEREMPATRFLRTPPLIAVEILSREDRAGDISDKIDDYLAFGVPNVWVVDPQRRHVTVYGSHGPQLCTTQVSTGDGSIVVPLDEIFGHMPDAATE
jgi:Uma2 family endonuclease